MKRSIKIDEVILEEVEQKGKAAHRSTASQAEYLIKLGLRAEAARDLSVQRFQRSLATVLSRDFAEGVKEGLYEKSDFTFVSSLKGPEFIDKLFRDGSRVTGRLSGGKFVECE